jgi:hypothetical protein
MKVTSSVRSPGTGTRVAFPGRNPVVLLVGAKRISEPWAPCADGLGWHVTCFEPCTPAS